MSCILRNETNKKNVRDHLEWEKWDQTVKWWLTLGACYATDSVLIEILWDKDILRSILQTNIASTS